MSAATAAPAAMTLYQFPLSHYCEKTRWQLDAKGLRYRTVNLFPGAHSRFTRKLAATGTVPILQDGPMVVADSTDISLYLENAYPAAPLLPSQAPQRERALALEALCDERGDDVRRWVYGQLLDHPELGRVLFRAYPPGRRLLGRAMADVAVCACTLSQRLSRRANPLGAAIGPLPVCRTVRAAGGGILPAAGIGITLRAVPFLPMEAVAHFA